MTNRTRYNTYQIMVDIETTGVHIASGAIWQIGAVDSEGETFSVTINPHQFLQSKATYEIKTVEWQEQNNESNWHEALSFGENQTEAWLVKEFFNWVRDRRYGAIGKNGAGIGKHFEIYSKGGFDFAFLSAASKEFEFSKPWHYREEIDLRTISTWTGIEQPKMKSGAHNALADAIHQMNHLQTMQQYQRMGW